MIIVIIDSVGSTHQTATILAIMQLKLKKIKFLKNI
nr:MAG TPA: hypothetical protein [Caudoviricetes sp.]